MEALLPEDAAEARITNAAVMELGAVLCTPARAPLRRMPDRRECAWRAAGYPPYFGPRGARQPRFEGSDRQARGRVMAELRAADVPVTAAEIALVLPDAVVRERILAGLLDDGLVVSADGGYALP